MNRWSRTDIAVLTAVSNGASAVFSMAAGIFLFRFILDRIGARDYGLWLPTGELLGYASLIDLGVLAVLPSMTAQLDGSGSRDQLRPLASSAIGAAVIAGTAYALIAAIIAGVWLWSGKIGAELIGPLALLVGLQAVAYPFLVFGLVLQGLQDVFVVGVTPVLQRVLSVLVTAYLVWIDWGLYALALGSVAPTFVIAGFCCWRAIARQRDLFEQWRRPRFDLMMQLVREGSGACLGSLGWRLTSASSGIIALCLYDAESVIVFAGTAKLSACLMPLAWQVTDGALIGVAQLYGQGDSRRLFDILQRLFRLALIISGAFAMGLLVFNPAFVILWVGRENFGGVALNAILVIGVVLQSFAHALAAVVSVLNYRFQIGVTSLVQGVVYFVVALALGRVFGLPGIAAATAIAAAVCTPVGIYYLAKITGFTFFDLYAGVLRPCVPRLVAILCVGYFVGVWLIDRSIWIAIGVSIASILAYAWLFRDVIRDIPVPQRLQRYWQRILPQPAGHSP